MISIHVEIFWDSKPENQITSTSSNMQTNCSERQQGDALTGNIM